MVSSRACHGLLDQGLGRWMAGFAHLIYGAMDIANEMMSVIMIREVSYHGCCQNVEGAKTRTSCSHAMKAYSNS